jgi:GTP-binding protein
VLRALRGEIDDNRLRHRVAEAATDDPEWRP